MKYEHLYDIKDEKLRAIEQRRIAAFMAKISADRKLEFAKKDMEDYTKELCVNKAKTLGLTKSNGYSDIFEPSLEGFKVIFKPKSMLFKVDMKTSQIKPCMAIE